MKYFLWLSILCHKCWWLSSTCIEAGILLELYLRTLVNLVGCAFFYTSVNKTLTNHPDSQYPGSKVLECISNPQWIKKTTTIQRHPEDDLFLDPWGIKKVKGPPRGERPHGCEALRKGHWFYLSNISQLVCKYAKIFQKVNLLKGMFTQKWKLYHHLLMLMSFQIWLSLESTTRFCLNNEGQQGSALF